MGEVGERALLREERPDPQLLECLCRFKEQFSEQKMQISLCKVY